MTYSGKPKDNTLYVKAGGLFVEKPVGQANGVASLGGEGLVPTEQLPTSIGGPIGPEGPPGPIGPIGPEGGPPGPTGSQGPGPFILKINGVAVPVRGTVDFVGDSISLTDDEGADTTHIVFTPQEITFQQVGADAKPLSWTLSASVTESTGGTVVFDDITTGNQPAYLVRRGAVLDNINGTLAYNGSHVTPTTVSVVDSSAWIDLPFPSLGWSFDGDFVNATSGDQVVMGTSTGSNTTEEVAWTSAARVHVAIEATSYNVARTWISDPVQFKVATGLDIYFMSSFERATVTNPDQICHPIYGSSLISVLSRTKSTGGYVNIPAWDGSAGYLYCFMPQCYTSTGSPLFYTPDGSVSFEDLNTVSVTRNDVPINYLVYCSYDLFTGPTLLRAQ